MRGWAKNFTRVSPLFGFFSKTTAYKLLPSHACLSSPLFLSLLAREGRWIRVLFCTLWNCEGRQRTVSVVVTAVHCSFHGPPSSHSAALCCVARSCSLLSLSFLVGYYYLAVLVFFFSGSVTSVPIVRCSVDHTKHTHTLKEREGNLKRCEVEIPLFHSPILSPQIKGREQRKAAPRHHLHFVYHQWTVESRACVLLLRR
jgi:hypothetical protein